MKIISILGARPQFIKASLVSRSIRYYNEHFNTGIIDLIIHTGQHFDDNMSKIFFDEMHIPLPAYNLNINSLTHGAMTGRMIERIEAILLKERPDWVLVYGDTNSTIAGALAAAKLHIKVAHVESGLRSFNMNMPEEINRILTDRISNVLFCPTENSVKNLKDEGFDNFICKIQKVGDVMFDSLLFYKNHAIQPAYLNLKKIPKDNFVFVTLHREANIDKKENLDNILNALFKISEDKRIVIPVHPRLKKKLDAIKVPNNIYLIQPCSYLETLWFLNNCSIVMTDSGGLQKEAYFLEKKCITLRNETEWTETLVSGSNILGGIKTQSIVSAYNEIRVKKLYIYDKNEFGAGDAAKKIVNYLYENRNG